MTPSAHRVARRYRSAAVVLRDEPSVDIIMSEGGVVSTGDLRRLLEPKFGPLFRMQLRPSLSGSPNTIAWEAHDEDAEVVGGKLVLHANLARDQVQVWAEVVIDGIGSTRHASTLAEARPPAVLHEGQIVSTDAIEAHLAAQHGPLKHVRLWSAITDSPAPVAVEAVTQHGRTIWAEVVVRTGVDGAGVSYWAELRLVPRGDGVVASAVPRQILDERLRDIATKARAILTKLRVQPQVPGAAIVGELVELVELAEGERPASAAASARLRSTSCPSTS